MYTKSDETVLYQCYQCILAKYINRKMGKIEKNTKNIAADKVALGNLTSKALLHLSFLGGEDRISTMEAKNHILSAKGLYVQYAQIFARNPEIVSDDLKRTMDQLIRFVSRYEAKMIYGFRMQEVGGERINLALIFDDKKRINSLGSCLARDVVSDYIRDKSTSVKMGVEFYVTNTGKKYHRKGCPYCRGKILSKSSATLVDNLKLSPCRCLTLTDKPGLGSSRFVTAFVDESIRPIKWDSEGKNGQGGSFSYIICRGLLKKETQINKDILIKEGVDFSKENVNIGHITEEAVGKVLISLAFDYGYDGNVRIYTDNISTVSHWNETIKNRRLSDMFMSVQVCYVSRKKNKCADRLGRKRMLLDIPMETYKEIVIKTEMVENAN